MRVTEHHEVKGPPTCDESQTWATWKPSVPRIFWRIRDGTAAAIRATYSESPRQEQSSKSNAESFQDGAVLWSARNRPGGALNFRLYERHSTNSVAIAVEAAFVDRDNIVGRLVTSWSSLYNGTPEQSCDFDAGTGLTKAWVYRGAMRLVDDSLSVEHVPETLKQATWSSFPQLWCGTGPT
ncbi:hypothetical protein LZ554_008756 [Drepanopeziza brunnea f. sp. 'monogermtubi']|nr:hypothetical protein LZ554_008756 [Drepanopeziza brunnea f. sp. 'monogermtubi']